MRGWSAARPLAITSVKPESNDFTPLKEQGARSNRASEDLPFDSAGGLSVNYHFPVDAQYVIKIKLPPLVQGFDAPSQVPIFLEKKIAVKAGNHRVGAAFLAENFVSESLGTGSKRVSVVPDVAVAAQLDLRMDGERIKLFDVEHVGDHPQLSSVTISGPYDIAGPGDTPSRRQIFVCRPSSPGEEKPCARSILTNLAHRAYRRPVTDADIKPLMAFYESGRAEGSFDLGISMALRALLVSPDFLFGVNRTTRRRHPVPCTV